MHVNGYGLQCLGVTHTQSSLSGAGVAESSLTQVIAVRVRPPVPTITTPAKTGTLQPTSLKIAVSGATLQGTAVTVYAERPGRDAVIAEVKPSEKMLGTYGASLDLLEAGTYRLTATRRWTTPRARAAGPRGHQRSAMSFLPTLKVANPADPRESPSVESLSTPRMPPEPISTSRSWVTAVDPSADGGADAVLDPTTIACQPAAGPPDPRFPLGVTPVTCSVKDAAGNRAADHVRRDVRVAGDAPDPQREQPDRGGAGTRRRARQLQHRCQRLHRGLRPAGIGPRPELPDVAARVLGSRLRPDRAWRSTQSTGDLYMAIEGKQRAQLYKSTTGGTVWQELTMRRDE